MDVRERINELLEDDPYLESELLDEIFLRLNDAYIRHKFGVLFNECYERLPRDIAIKMCELLEFPKEEYGLIVYDFLPDN